MKKVIYLTIIFSISSSIASDIKIQQKVFQFLPQIIKNYSITKTVIYPPQITKYQYHIQPPPQPSQPSIKTPPNSITTINKARTNLRREIKPQIRKPILPILKTLQFQQFHQIQFKASKKNNLINIDDISVLNSLDLSIKLEEKKQKSKSLKIPAAEIKAAEIKTAEIKTMYPFHQPPIPKKQRETDPKHSNKQQKENKSMLKKNDDIQNSKTATKIIFTIMLFASIVLVIFFYAPENEKRKTYIPSNDDDEQNQLQ